MDIVYLNGSFLQKQDAAISILDRGLLFGDSIYEVIPVENAQLIGFELHMERLNRNLNEVKIPITRTNREWKNICEQLIRHNGNDRHLYLQISRGTAAERLLQYPAKLAPTVFGFSLARGNEDEARQLKNRGFRVATAPDIRWQRCDIKSTSMLASALTLTDGAAKGCDEVLLYNSRNELTEGCSVNVLVMKNGILATPALDNQILPGITRHILLSILRDKTDTIIEERPVSMAEVHAADEVLLTSSTRSVVAVVEIDGKAIGDGRPGSFVRRAQALYRNHMFEY